MAARATLQQAIDGLYIVMYNRAADAKGYTYWGAQASGALSSIATTNQFTTLANDFYAATPAYFDATYGTLSDVQFVQQLYVNMGGKAGDQAGVLFWASLLAEGTNRQGLVGEFVQAFINFDPANVTGLSAADIAAAQERQQTFLNKIVVSEAYAAASATNPFLIPAGASASDPAFVTATNVIQGVNDQGASVDSALNKIAAAVVAGHAGANVNITAGGGPITVGDVKGVLASNQPTGTVTINDNVLVGFNNLPPVGSAAGAVLINKGYIKVAGISNEVLADGTPISVNNDYSTSKFAPLPAAIVAVGGTDVTVNTNTGATITVGGDSALTGTLATGNIVVNNSASDLLGKFGIGTYAFPLAPDNITGGKDVTVTEAGNGVTIGSGAVQAIAAQGNSFNAADNATGTIKVTETVASNLVVAIDGGNGVTVNALGQAVIIGANTGTAGAQKVTQAGQFTGNGVGSAGSPVTIDGGTTVDVATTGGSVKVGAAAIANGAVGVPTGAVTITDTFSGANTASGDAFAVLGGSTVTINVPNTTAAGFAVGAAPVLNGTGTALGNAALSPTGDVTINNGTNNTAATKGAVVFTNGAKTVSLTGTGPASATTISDVNSFANAALTAVGVSTLATVNLTNAGGLVVIDSNAITNLNITNSLKASATTAGPTAAFIGFPAPPPGFTAIPAHTLNLNLNNTAAGTAVLDATATQIIVTTSGAAADSTGLGGAAVTNFTFNNAANVTVTGAAMAAGKVDTVVAQGSGALVLGDTTTTWTGITNNLASITSTGSGAVWASINGDTTTYKGGSGGGNILTVYETTGGVPASRFDGGAGGNNTVQIANDAAIYNTIPDPVLFHDFTNFQNLGLLGAVGGQPGVGATSPEYNVSGGWNNVLIGGVSNGVIAPVAVTNGLYLEQAAAATQLTYTASAGLVYWAPVAGVTAATVNLGVDGTKAAGGTGGVNAGVLLFNVGKLLGGGPNAGDGIETVTLNSFGTGKGQNLINLTDTHGAGKKGIATLNISGDENILVVNSDFTVTTINASGSTAPGTLQSFLTTGVVGVNISSVNHAATGVTITGGGSFIVANSLNGSTVASVDTLTTGSGGGFVVLGKGGAGTLTAGEFVKLGNSGALRDWIFTPFLGAVGERAVVTGFQMMGTGSSSRVNGDMLQFAVQPVVAANNAAVIEGPNTYRLSNGVFTLLTGTPTSNQQVLDTQAYLDTQAPGAIGMITIDSGNTYVIQNEGGGGADAIIQLSGVATGNPVLGFGVAFDAQTAPGKFPLQFGAGSAIEIMTTTPPPTMFANVSKANGGTAGGTAYDLTGFAVDTLTAGAPAATNTYNNLANFAIIKVAGTAGGNLVTHQIGLQPELLIQTTSGGAALTSVSVDGAAAFDTTAGNLTVKNLITPDDTVYATDGAAVGLNTLTIGQITDASLKTVEASVSAGNLVLGSAASQLAQAGLTVNGPVGNLTVFASGAGDTINAQDGLAQINAITANGAGDVIKVGVGANTITANGAGDQITLGVTAGAGAAISVATAQIVHANGAGDTITFATKAADGSAITFDAAVTIDGGPSGPNILGIGNNSTVNFGNGVGLETVTVTGALAGATTAGGTSVAGISFITLNNVVVDGHEAIVLNNVGGLGPEVTAGFTFGASQVNVAQATSLAQAFDIAAATAGLSQQTAAGVPGVIAAHTGVVDWFQFGGNTYIVEAINNGISPSTHTALTAGDQIIKITGLVDLSGAAGLTAPHTITF